MWRSQAIVLSVLLLVSLALLLAPVLTTGSEGALAVAREPARGVCTPCHTSEKPTSENPCLRTCPRSAVAPIIAESTTDRAPRTPPDVVMLDDLEDLYLPVPFDHKGHASMSEMTTGCQACHHHSPADEEHPACRSCHGAAKDKDDIRMPGLKGAYHRQCLNCHLEWSHDTACSVCHLPKLQRGIPTEPTAQPSAQEVVDRMNPPVQWKTTYVFETPEAPEPIVTFHHADHIQTFSVRCVQCHRGASCGHCHDETISRDGSGRHGGSQRLKNTCFACHKESNCSFCHGDARRPSFDHASDAGWPLEPYHADVPCGDCHGPATDFSVPSKACWACHERRPIGSRDGAIRNLIAIGDVGDTQCLTCHTDMKDRFSQAACVHGPAADGTGCAACHTEPHSPTSRPPRDRMRDFCLGCHDRPIDTGHGRPLRDIAAALVDRPNHHGPIREGNCCACHEPHASDHARLLTGKYASGFYAPFDIKQYELCFRCHNQEQVSKESGTVLTGFRKGDLNLHWLHVNREKGRTCRACHEIHASRQPFHMRESVPFGDSGWMLPVNYQRTDTGGTCTPGCHVAKSYSRDHAARALTPAATARPPLVASQDAKDVRQ